MLAKLIYDVNAHQAGFHSTLAQKWVVHARGFQILQGDIHNQGFQVFTIQQPAPLYSLLQSVCKCQGASKRIAHPLG